MHSPTPRYRRPSCQVFKASRLRIIGTGRLVCGGEREKEKKKGYKERVKFLDSILHSGIFIQGFESFWNGTLNVVEKSENV